MLALQFVLKVSFGPWISWIP